MITFTAIRADITTLKVDAIVNAANTSLLGGGGVDGAIHRAAGPQLLDACRLLRGCKTGEAKATPGFNLPAKWIFHTAGPVWRDGNRNEDDPPRQLLPQCLDLAHKHACDTIAFPAISTGIYGFPKPRAAAIAVETVRTWSDSQSKSRPKPQTHPGHLLLLQRRRPNPLPRSRHPHPISTSPCPPLAH